MEAKARILVIEDDRNVAGSLKKELKAEGYEAVVASRGDEGLTVAKREAFAVVLTDLKLPGLSGLDLVGQLRIAKPKLPIILMTAFGTTETTIEAIRLGAYEYVQKPFDMPEVLDMVAQAVACESFNSGLLELGTAECNGVDLVGQSRAMQALCKEIGRAGQASMNVLVRGETGTGKELVARAIHQHSNRAGQPFVAVNCTAIPETLLESALFGHEKGAFTGASARHIGRFEQARGGTLFLDEIGDLNPGTQAKLLRVLQERTIQRVGGNVNIAVDARVLAATHRDLETAMKERQFREDLFYRLNALTIRVPSLGERLEDLPDLVRHFLHRCCAEVGVATPSIRVEAVDYLRHQSWPGNVRELENVVRQALVFAREHPISLAHVREAHAHVARPAALPNQTIAGYVAELLAEARQGKVANAHTRMVEDMERVLFTQAIELAQGNQARAARWSGVTRTTMREKLVHFGLRVAAAEPTSGDGIEI